MKSISILRLLLILAAEVLASMAVWHGTPTDWVGEPLHFWSFEILRLQYWCGFGLLFAGLWVIGWLSLRRHSPKLAPALLGAVCLLGTEVTTSIYFWRSLSSNQVGYLGWPDFRRYFWEHLISWFVVVSVGAALWYIWNKRRGEQRGKIASGIIALLALCIASFAQDTAYYTAIQKASSSKVQPAQFKQMEENALKDFSRPESYELAGGPGR